MGYKCKRKGDNKPFPILLDRTIFKESVGHEIGSGTYLISKSAICFPVITTHKVSSALDTLL